MNVALLVAVLGCLCVCSAVVSLLQTVVDTSDTHGCELLYSAVQLEWNSFSRK